MRKAPAPPGPAPRPPAGLGDVSVTLAYLGRLERWTRIAERYIEARDRGEVAPQLRMDLAGETPAAR